MKTTIKKLGLLVAMLLAILPISAYDFEVDGIYYDIISLSDMTCSVVKGDSPYEGDIVIPSEVTYRDRQFSVTKIGNSTFFNSKITSVILPNSITSIISQMFLQCTSLVSVTIPDSVIRIGDDAFGNCTSLKNIIIPNSVIEIGTGAFSNCSALETIEIPNYVKVINSNAFEYCTSLLYVDLPDSVSSIDSYAFKKCKSLTSISLPNSLTNIGAESFQGCKSLGSISIPNSVNNIGPNAFAQCESLTSIKLSDNLLSIRNGLFTDCKSLKNLEIPGSVQKLEQYLDKVNEIKQKTFENCDNLTYLRLSSSSENLSTGYYFDGKTVNGYEKKFVSSGWDNWTSSIKELYLDRHLERAISVPNLEVLEVGSSINSVDVEKISDLKNLTILKSHALVPPSLKGISNDQYMDLSVFVPEEALEEYKADSIWGSFWNLQGDSNLNSVESVNGNLNKTIIRRYNISGSPVNDNYKGIVIICFSDGSTKKIIQK